MSTLSSFIESMRYDLKDVQEGVQFDEKQVLLYINRIIPIIDSRLARYRSTLLYGTETDIDCVASQDYIDITNLNNGHFDSIEEVWIGTDKLEKICLPELHYKSKFQTADEKPQFWTQVGNRILFPSGADSAHTDVVIHYLKKTRPRLASWSDTFTAANATEIFTVSPAMTFITGDGIFQVSNSGGALPTGLAASTNYYLIFLTPTTFQLATSVANAEAGTELTISDDGSGTNTITLTETMPYGGRLDDLIREMVVGHMYSKASGQQPGTELYWESLAKRRIDSVELRRQWVPTPYYIDF